MAIDASIALGVKPVQIESPLNQMSNVYALQNAQQSNQLNQMKMEEYKRGVAQSEQRRNYLSTAKRDDPEFINNLAAIDPELAMKLETHMAGINKEKALADTAKFKLANDNYTQYRSTLAGLSTVPNLTKDMAISEAQRLVDAGVVPANFVTMAQQLPDEPTALRSVLQNGARAQLTPDKIFTMFAPKPVERATNTYKEMYDENPASRTFGQVIPNSRIEMGISPDAQLRANIDQLKATTAQTKATQTQQAKTSVATAGQATISELANKLNGLYDELDKGGGIVSTKMREGSNIGRALSGSYLGRATGHALGGENQRIRESIENTRPLLLQAIKSATGMSAKQMDSNVELKMYLMAATDPTKSLESNKEALATLVRLYGIGGVGVANVGDATESAAPVAPAAKTKDQLDYEAFINAKSGAKRR